MEGAHVNAHDLIADILEKKGSIDSVFWIACGGSLIDLLPAHALAQREGTTFSSDAYTAREFDIMRKGSIDSVFWIACGGSLIDLLPAHALAQREGTTFSSDAYTAREFDIMRPKRLGERSLVIACSHSGNTPEVIRSCKIAREAGAAVIAFTNQGGSGIDLDLWTSWVYPWSDDVSQLKVPAGITLLLAGELLDQQEGYADLADLYAGVAKHARGHPLLQDRSGGGGRGHRVHQPGGFRHRPRPVDLVGLPLE